MTFRWNLSFTCLLVGICLLLSCQNERTDPLYEISGETMGTAYSVVTRNHKIDKNNIDALLVEFNDAVSTYIPSSVISRFNESTDTFHLDTTDALHYLFFQNVLLAKSIHAQSKGAFEPTVMPLVNLWGFGYSERNREEMPDSMSIVRAKDLVGFDKVRIIFNRGEIQLIKEDPNVELDLSASAKGYGVDIVAGLLDAMGCTDYLIEIGGEVRTLGRPNHQRPWKVGVNKPLDKPDSGLFAAVTLENKAMATSGNYQNYYMLDGKKVSHTINPNSGYPEYNRLLSASILTDKCAVADAFATACMVVGLEKAQDMIESRQDLEGYLIFEGDDGNMTSWRSKGLPDINKYE